MNSEIKNFFELFIGYNGENWSVDHAKKHNSGVHSYFLHDMEKMINNQVGYPSVLYLMNIIAFLGYCLKFDPNWEIPAKGREKNNEFKNAGKIEDFEDFCKRYLKQFNESYAKLAYSLFELVRHRLSHIFFTNNFITTYSVDKHLEIERKGSDNPVMWISVGVFFEDTKKAIELAYKELEQNREKAVQFSKKQKFLLEWAWKKQKGILNSVDLEDSNRTTFLSKPDYPSNGVSGVPYTPPPEVF